MEMFRIGFQVHAILFPVMFLLIAGLILTELIKSARQWHRDNKSPRLTVAVTVVSKREDYRRRRNGNNTSHRTYYYATFQVESGDRMELQLEGWEYGMIVEGDRGNLTFQGSRFLGFERT